MREAEALLVSIFSFQAQCTNATSKFRVGLSLGTFAYLNLLSLLGFCLPVRCLSSWIFDVCIIILLIVILVM